jgi:hypothetical protein
LLSRVNGHILLRLLIIFFKIKIRFLFHWLHKLLNIFIKFNY